MCVCVYIYAPPNEEECTKYTVLGLCTDWFSFFCDEPMKDAHHKGKTCAGWVSPQLINTPITTLKIRLTDEMGMKKI